VRLAASSSFEIRRFLWPLKRQSDTICLSRHSPDSQTIHMSTQHTVLPGEHLAGIAAAAGFADFMTVWNAPENAKLRELRHSPNILLPGDIVTIPEKIEQSFQGADSQRHEFTLFGPELLLNLKLEDTDGDPIADTDCVLHVSAKDENGRLSLVQEFKLTTDKSGKISQRLSEDANIAELAFDGEDKFLLVIGGLNPVREPTGMRQRLNNLGYFAGLVSEDREQLRWATEEFQHDHAITPPNGDLDDPRNAAKIDRTKNKLGEIHGDLDKA
jgi:hypothetical protein